MPSQERRAAARRRAWGRGPIILKIDQLEGRQLLTAHAQPLPDLAASSFTTVHNADWGDSLTASGTILNQGTVTAESGFKVAIYASPQPSITRNSVKIGEVSIPAGLAPGQSSAFKDQITLPSSAIPGFASSAGVVYIGLWVDPQRSIHESNKHNNEDLGAPYDTSPIQITASQPSDLVGTSLSVTPNQLEWGNTVQLYTQIRNGAQGNAPATIARVVLTPVGVPYGTGQDVTVGTFPVPAINAWQTVNLVQTVTLPTLPPTQLAGSTQFTLTVVPDSTFLTNTIYPGYGPQGPGLDQTPITVNPVSGANVSMTGTLTTSSAVVTGLSSTSSLVLGQVVEGVGIPAGTVIGSINSPSQVTLTQAAQTSGATALTFLANPNDTATRGPLPDLASTTMTVPTTPLAWGRSFNVSTAVQNIGQGNSGPFNVVYMLVGASGSLANGIVLADVPINGVNAGATMNLTQTLQLPVRVPSGLTLDSVGVGKIAMVIDPENMIDEVTKNDNVSISGPITLRLLGTDGSTTVPNAPPITLTQTVAPTPTAAKSPRRHPVVVHTPKKIHRRPVKHSFTFTTVAHNLTVFPTHVEDLVKNIFK